MAKRIGGYRRKTRYKFKKEQREKGANPDVCPIFDMSKYHLILDDKDLENLKEACKSGNILCGECKGKRFESLQKLIENHNLKKKKFIDISRKILKVD